MPVKFYGEKDSRGDSDQSATGNLAINYSNMKNDMKNDEYNSNIWNSLQTVVEVVFGKKISIF